MHHKLYIARRENRLKQVDMAKILKITNVTYSRKETGISEFTLQEALTLAEHFGLTVDELFKKEGV